MCILCTCHDEKSYTKLIGMIILDISYCNNITSIPNDIPHEITSSITTIICNDCTSLTNLPHWTSILEVFCYRCTSLTTLPHWTSIQEVDCRGCTSLTIIPYMPKLINIRIYNCPLLWIPHKLAIKTNNKSKTIAHKICTNLRKRRNTVRLHKLSNISHLQLLPTQILSLISHF